MKCRQACVGLWLAAGLAVLVWQTLPAFAEGDSKATVGQSAPGFKLKDVYGKEFSLEEFRGHIVVLEWTNYECPYVKAHHQEKQTTQKLYAKYADKGIVWLGIDSTHTRKPDQNRKWAAANRIAYPILHDPTGSVGHAYGAKTTPHMFVIDKDGVLAYAGAIDDTKNTNYVDAAIASLLDGKKPDKTETKPYGCSVKYAKPAAASPAGAVPVKTASADCPAATDCPALKSGSCGPCPKAGSVKSAEKPVGCPAVAADATGSCCVRAGG